VEGVPYVGRLLVPAKYRRATFDIEADMFDGAIDISQVASINFVEWPKRGKFLPRP
jgi:hypothetical protein